MGRADPPSPVHLDPPEDVLWITRKLENAGFSTWAVGGAVRDGLAGGKPGDWDLATAARPEQVRRIFRRTVPLGVEHGTVGVLGPSGRMYEVTTFRRDVETFGRHARVTFAERIEEDLERRDFTMNAIAWHPLTHVILDPHGGLSDLSAGILRTVGDPPTRFAEDRLRVLRALRFAGAFQLQIEPATWRAVTESADKLGNLSAERVREELWKVLSGQRDPRRSLSLYAESGVLRSLYPELDACRGVQSGIDGVDLWGLLVHATASVPMARPLIRLAALLHAAGGADVPDGASHDPAEIAGRSAAIAREMLRRLRFSNATTDRVTHLIAQQAPIPPPDALPPELSRWVRRVGPEYLNDLFRLLIARLRAEGRAGKSDAKGRGRELRRLRSRVAALLRTGPALSISDLAIGGNDLRALGLAPGPSYGRILDELLERVTDQPELNSREVLLDVARDLIAREEPAPRGEGWG